MKPAPVQNSSSLASHTWAFSSLLSMVLVFLFVSISLNAQVDTTKKIYVPIPEHMPDKGLKLTPQLIRQVFPRDEWNYFFLTTEQKKKRQWLIGGLNVMGYGASILIFNNQWYKEHPRTSFHSFNDSKEWLQMDKMGHIWASYNAGRASTAMWKWAGVESKKAVWIGGLSSTVYLTVIEFLDAHSSKWGWSWADMGANLFGSGLFIGQQLGWKEQRIQLKFSFHHKNYSEPILKQRADDLFGSSWTERMLKDYNGQTYWLSANLRSFLPTSNLPAWLNIAVGYGAEGMFGGFENKWTDGDPGFPVDRTDIKRYRQWYLAPDINFSKIKTNSKAVRVLFAALDAFKFPTPSLEFSNAKIRVNAIHF